MLAIYPINRDAHLEDMAAFLSVQLCGASRGEWAVRIVGGLLLISAGNTAISGMISIQYLMARDGRTSRAAGEAQSLRRSLACRRWSRRACRSWSCSSATISTNSPRLYAIGVIGAVAINISLCAFHPRLRRLYRKIPMMLLGESCC